MRTVMVTKFAPLPADNGGKKRSLAIAQRLATLGEVVLCAFDDGHADVEGLAAAGVDARLVPWRPTLGTAGRGLLRTASVSAGRFWDPALARVVREAAGDGPVDHLQVEYPQMTPYAARVRARRRVVDFHNVESALTRRLAHSTGGGRGLLFRAEAHAIRRLERRACATFDAVMTVTEADRARLPPTRGDLLVCANGWEPGPLLPPASDPVVAFVALMGWAPNSEAASWFTRGVWPEVRAAVPGAKLLLVGRDPTPEVQSLRAADVVVTGTVPDVTAYVAESRVALAPLLTGGGSRLKILEALGAGRPVVATTVGAEGLEDLVGRGVVVADDADSMAAAVTRLLTDPDEAAALGRAGHDAIVDRYAWDRTLAPLLEWVTG